MTIDAKAEQLLDVCRILANTGDLAIVEGWKIKARDRITAGKGQLVTLTGASLAGKSTSSAIVADAVALLWASSTAIAEKAGLVENPTATRILYSYL